MLMLRSEFPQSVPRPPQPPRVAVISSAYPVRSETFVFREVHGLRKRGWSVITITLHDPPEPAQAVLGDDEPHSIGVYDRSLKRTLSAAIGELLRHPLRTLRTIATACSDALRAARDDGTLRSRLRLVPQAVAAIGLAGKLRGLGVSLLHCHFAHAPTTLGMYAAMQLGVPFSFVGHANDLYQRRVLLRVKLRRAAFVSCISQPHRELYMSLVQRDDAAYPIIRCGVDTEQFQPHDTSRSGGSLLTVCRLVEKKGIDTLIYALAKLRHASGNDDDTWRLTIAGSGPDEARLRALVGKLNCSEAVHWAGAVTSEQVCRVLNAADIFVLPCREDSNGDRDGIPVVLMEAMASGVPVIAGDIQSIRDLVRHGETGLLVPGNNADAVADAIRRLANDSAEHSRLARAAREHVETEFSQRKNIDRLERAIGHSLGWRDGISNADTATIPSRTTATRSASIEKKKQESHV